MAPDIFWGEMGSLLICIMNAARMSWEAIFKSIKKCRVSLRTLVPAKRYLFRNINIYVELGGQIPQNFRVSL